MKHYTVTILPGGICVVGIHQDGSSNSPLYFDDLEQAREYIVSD